MNVRLSAVLSIAATVVVATTACGTDSSTSAGSATSAGSTTTASSAGPAATRTTAIGEQPGAPPQPGGAPQPATAQQPAPGATAVPEPSVAATSSPATQSAPEGSGHGLCFDVNSALAASSVATLAAPPGGGSWTIQGASEDPIAAGCSGVLSWMTVEWPGIHPGTHVLFFTGGKYLGTASARPYGYTTVLGKTRDTVSVQYRWPLKDDALCCPQGGPSVVTFTLNGTTVQANGQFPPEN
ncbi:LppP/LprE family lipoprotein [Nocardia sp. NPDC047038]|uniref:LppP/LprE family lipoprotein n=2 Tax=Nocardiaceae TaxID=85025 RepID=UPI0033E316A6